MTSILLTHATGDASRILDMTEPVFADYAARHGYTLRAVRTDSVAPLSSHWNKIALIREALAEADLVVWMDADVLVRDVRDIAETLPLDAAHGLCIEETEQGIGPNTGVWVLRPHERTLQLLDEVWALGPISGAVLNDQARVSERLGFSWAPQRLRPLRGSPYLESMAWIPSRWNMLTVYHPEAALVASAMHFGGLTTDEKCAQIRQQILVDRLPGWEALCSPALRVVLGGWTGASLRLVPPPAPAMSSPILSASQSLQCTAPQETPLAANPGTPPAVLPPSVYVSDATGVSHDEDLTSTVNSGERISHHRTLPPAPAVRHRRTRTAPSFERTVPSAAVGLRGDTGIPRHDDVREDTTSDATGVSVADHAGPAQVSLDELNA